MILALLIDSTFRYKTRPRNARDVPVLVPYTISSSFEKIEVVVEKVARIRTKICLELMELLAKITRRKAGRGWLDNRSTNSDENLEVAQAYGSLHDSTS